MMEQVSKIWQDVLQGKNFEYGLPINISTHGDGVDLLITVLHWFMAMLFVGWGIYLVYCLVKFREREGHKADVSHKHFNVPKYLEIVIVITEVVLLVFFSYPVWARVKTDFPDRNTALVIKVTAEQFAWNVHYSGKDGKFGKTNIDLIDGTNPIGLDREDADAKDDVVTVNQLNIPVGKPVIIELNSKDVIHSFFLPVARVKQDIIPGTVTPIWFEAKQTGNFEIACAQLCGVGHYRMRGYFNVMSQADYDKWLQGETDALLGTGTAAPEKAQDVKENK